MRALGLHSCCLVERSDEDDLQGLISIARLPPPHDESGRRRGRADGPEKIESTRRLQRLQAHEGKAFQLSPPIEFTWSSSLAAKEPRNAPEPKHDSAFITCLRAAMATWCRSFIFAFDFGL